MAQIPATMSAVRIAHFGAPDVVATARIDVPRPGAGEVLLKIHGASVNPVDWKIRAGQYPEVTEDMLPYTLGRDVSGDVVSLGQGVETFKEGDALYAFLGVDRGAYAEYVLVRDTEGSPKPTTIDPVTAASVPLAGITAWQGLFLHGGLKAGERVLIHAGSGGVGHLAVQFAKARGAHVITTVSAANVDFAKRLGADEVIDHRKTRFEDKVKDVDLVLDLLGKETQARSWGVLKKGGALVSTITAPSQDEAARRGVRASRFTAQPSASDLREIGLLIDGGQVKPHVSKVFSMQDARSALQAVEAGHTVGKVVLRMT